MIPVPLFSTLHLNQTKELYADIEFFRHSQGCDIDGHEVTLNGKSTVSNETIAAKFIVHDMKFRLPYLEPATDYDLKAYAFNSKGKSSRVTQMTFTTVDGGTISLILITSLNSRFCFSSRSCNQSGNCIVDS